MYVPNNKGKQYEAKTRFVHKFDNFSKIDQILGKHNLPKSHTHTKEIDNLNRSTSIKEIESIINKLKKQKAPG